MIIGSCATVLPWESELRNCFNTLYCITNRAVVSVCDVQACKTRCPFRLMGLTRCVYTTAYLLAKLTGVVVRRENHTNICEVLMGMLSVTLVVEGQGSQLYYSRSLKSVDIKLFLKDSGRTREVWWFFHPHTCGSKSFYFTKNFETNYQK